MKKMELFRDKIFYQKLWHLAFPIALQSLMLAAVAAMDALGWDRWIRMQCREYPWQRRYSLYRICFWELWWREL